MRNILSANNLHFCSVQCTHGLPLWAVAACGTAIVAPKCPIRGILSQSEPRRAMDLSLVFRECWAAMVLITVSAGRGWARGTRSLHLMVNTMLASFDYCSGRLLLLPWSGRVPVGFGIWWQLGQFTGHHSRQLFGGRPGFRLPLGLLMEGVALPPVTCNWRLWVWSSLLTDGELART